MKAPDHPAMFLVMNPSSRSFHARYQWPGIFEGLKRRGVRFDFALTRKEGDPSDLVRQAVLQGFNTVVAVGGDGTINDVINGLFDPVSETSSAALGVLYTGTSPDFCRNHKIPTEMEPALDLLVSGSRRRVDVCRIAHRSSPGGPRVFRLFSGCATVGLGAEVARGANSGLRKRFGDVVGTLFSLIAAMVRYRPPVLRVTLDGEEKCFPGLVNLFIGKSPLVASEIKLTIDIPPDDGRMYVLPIYGISKTRAMVLLPRMYSGSITRRFPPLFARHVGIAGWGEANEVEYDGDPRGFLPAEIRVLPRGLELIRP